MTCTLPELPRPPWHPLLEFLSDQEVEALLDCDDGLDKYKAAYHAHLAAVRAAEWDESQPMLSNPARDGWELPQWHEADILLGRRPRTPETAAQMVQAWRLAPYVQTFAPELRQLLEAGLPEPLLQEVFYIWIGLGGNRSGKSEYCAKRVVQDALRHPNALIVCLAETLESGIVTQQQLIWKYLPPDIKRLNKVPDKRGVFNINYSKKGGFTKESLILPNGAQIMFKSYKGEPGDVEGWMLGSRTGRCIGMWLDESATTGWFEAGKRRCKYCGAILLWSFTPIKGMTPAIKEAVGEAETVKTLPAELLSPEVRHVPGCPPGHMPYLQRARTDGAIVQYFFSQFNPFGTAAGPFYQAVQSLCRNDDGSPKASTHIKRVAYGYTEDTTGRRFPGYCGAHVVKVKHLPATAAVYQFTDPHGSRPYASIWVLVTPGNPPNYYVVRDWPDERTYGEWAIPTMRETSDETRRGWDGDAGPAQRELGWGVIQYKKMWAEAERVKVPFQVQELVKAYRETMVWNEPEWNRVLSETVKYPWHRRIISEAVSENEPLEDLREWVVERSMDSRFCNAEHAAENGGKCLRQLYEEDQTTPDGRILTPSMLIREASGKDIEHGCGLITDLLAYEKDQDLIPHINAPRLWISEECTQVRWALENYTGRAGQAGACKEWIDVLRHLAEAAPLYVTKGLQKAHGQGSY